MEQEVKLITGGVSVDDRGSVRFVNGFNFAEVKRFYQVANHKVGFIRAWHAHKEESKYVYVSSGSALVGAVNLDTEEVKKFVLSDSAPSVLYIPSGYANGFMSLSADTSIIFFSTSLLEDSRADDLRYPYNKWDIWREDYR